MNRETSHNTENKQHENRDDFAGQPDEAMFLVLAYLPLFELLAMTQVCKSLRDALENDILPWLNIIVEKPLNSRLHDDILMRIASKANGRLRTLALRNCVKITDEGIQAVIVKNPHITKLHIPACTTLTPEGVIRAVKTLNLHNHSLRSLKINGLPNLNKEHLEALCSLLEVVQAQQQNLQTQKQRKNFYPEYKHLTVGEEQETSPPSIDVEPCPKCDEVRMVFNCPKETCQRKSVHVLTECRGCTLCILRCEECGSCVDAEEECEAACEDILCTFCWLQLPKCCYCNKPYCNQHIDRQCTIPGSSGFVCDACHAKFITNYYY